MQYLVNLNCKINADTEEQAKAQALMNIQIREATYAITTPLSVYERLKTIRGRAKEHLIVFLLNVHHKIIKQEVVSVGTLDSSLLHPREIYRSAIKAGCSHIILAHSHPSGSLEPSEADLTATRRIADSGRLLGIELLDHVIVTKHGYYSLKEHNNL
ncbi:MAG: JAB domain-containing protein [Candidatus Doudnabacteria bacterium]|nr:JAB domain-containing protein [Candidatus Doudnabacteria bacterium]